MTIKCLTLKLQPFLCLHILLELIYASSVSSEYTTFVSRKLYLITRPDSRNWLSIHYRYIVSGGGIVSNCVIMKLDVLTLDRNWSVYDIFWKSHND